MAKVKKDISGYIITAMVAAVAGAGGGYLLAGGSGGSSDYGKAVKRIKEARAVIAEKGDPDFDDKKAADGIVNGYLSAGGDKYTCYFNYNEIDDTTAMTSEINGAPTSFGSGFAVDKSENGNIILTSVTPGMAADKQGLKVNDEIIAIDGVSIAEQTYEKYARKILGKPDTEVKLTILRDGKEFEINFKRVNKGGKIIDNERYGEVGYLKIRSFSDFTIGQLGSNLEALGNVKGLVIDLRENPGGENASVIDIASRFITTGKLSLKRFDGTEKVMSVSSDQLMTDLPVVVLINENTVSAAEIMTALLKDNKQGCRLVGVNTRGKGIFQQEEELKSGGTVHYTAGKFYVDDRENWHGVGIKPDVVVEMDSKLIGTDEDIQLKKAIELLD